jgi:hypothetical protein
MLRRVFGGKRNEVTGVWRELYMWSSIVCIVHKMLLALSDQEK